MREIVFRGRKLTDGKWVEGFLITWPDGYPNIYQPDTYKGYTVEPATVGQYTGLKDTKGNRIFEGDILRSIHVTQPFIVRFGEYVHYHEYEEKECGFYCDDGQWPAPLGGTEEWAIKIGNIHDKPELLT